MGTLRKEQMEAAKEFENFILNSLQSEKGIHAETAVATSARMAGTFLFRSFAFPMTGIEPGQPVFSNAANEQGPKLVAILGSLLNQIGVQLDQNQIESADEKSKPPLIELLETQKKFESGMSAIKDRLRLSYQESAESAAISTALIIKQCRQVLDPHIAFKIAIRGFVEASKTAPHPIKI
jgi:hypothetical protein